jgi:hypothetical protein
MAIQHRDIPEDGLHEPKGVSGASSGEVYVADGAGSGSWVPAPTNPDNIVIERLLDGLSVATDQQPAGVDTPLQIEFGPAQFGPSDPVSLSAAGVLTFNEAGTYRVKISIAAGRTGGAGVSNLYFRALVNGAQAGQSVHLKVDSSNIYIPYSDEAWLTLPAGVTISYEVLRDSTGNNSGGLFQSDPTLAGWADNPSAAIRVERWATA